MELLDPKVIVTLGRHSLLRFYPEGKISKDHGKILQWEGRILFPLYHPAAGLRNPAIKVELQQDVLRLPEALRESIRISPIRTAKSEPETDTDAQVTVAPTSGPTSEKTSNQKDVEPQLSELQLMNETNQEKEEQGDRQLGMF